MVKKIMFLYIFSLWLITGNLFAQTIQDLRIGTFINVTLSPGQEIWYRVTTPDAGIITVETTGNIDTYIEAYDAQRNMLSSDDDGGENYNAKVDLVVLRGASYLFMVRGFNSEESGSFRVFASHKPMPAMTELRAGSSLSGNIASGQEYWYIFRSTREGILTVQTAGDTDTYLRVLDENFATVKSDDDSGEDNNAKIEINVKQGGIYHFVLSAYSSNSGPYRIVASIRDFPNPVQLNPGSFQSGNIVSEQEYWYSVRPSRAGRLVVETVGSTDTRLEAYTESFELLDSDDDGGEEANARIELMVEANRTYIFKLFGWSFSSGPFRIMANLSDFPNPTQLNPGSFLSGNMISGQDYWYSVRTTSRGRLIVETSGSLDTLLSAYSGTYTHLASDDDGGENLNARIIINVEPNQTYIFRLRGYSDNSGPYRIFASME